MTSFGDHGGSTIKMSMSTRPVMSSYSALESKNGKSTREQTGLMSIFISTLENLEKVSENRHFCAVPAVVRLDRLFFENYKTNELVSRD